MKYRDCISVTMSLVSYLLDNDIWCFYNDNNLNRLKIKLNSEGFILEEESRFGSDPTYEEGYNGIELSPTYLIKRLFDGNVVEDENRGHSITMLIHSLPDYEFQEPISYVKVVELIDKMRESFINGNADIFSYWRLKKYFASFKRDNSWSLKNQVLSLESLNYENLINVSNEKKEIARKIERMYQVEKLLVKYSKLRVIEKQGRFFRFQDFNNDFVDLDRGEVAKIDLESESTDWKDFTNMVSFFNKNEMQKSTKDWHNVTRDLNYHPNLTVLGLDEMVLPGTPRKYQKKM